MSILNVNKINPVGGGSTITIAGIASVTNAVSVGNSVTANAFYGSGANLSGITQTTINSNGANRIITGSGSANTLEGNSNFTYTGSVVAHNNPSGLAKLDVKGSVGGGALGASISVRNTNSANNGSGEFQFQDPGSNIFAKIVGTNLTDSSNNGYMSFHTSSATSGLVERLRITDAGDLLFKKTSSNDQTTGVQFDNHGLVRFTKDNIVAYFIRTSSDGQMIRFYGDSTSEGSINISGTSISYNGGVLSRWSQIVGISTNNKADRPTIYQGTVMTNLDEMCDWGDEENMQLNKTQVSTVSGDKNVAGVFWAWDDDDDTYLNDYYVAQTGDYIIRVGAATTVTRGDLLESAGDGTAKPQSDDIVRSKTVAKVTSGIAHTTYPDGTKTYPCVLMAS